MSSETLTDEKPFGGANPRTPENDPGMGTFSREDVGRTYDILRHRYQTEIRCIDPHGRSPPQIFFVNTREAFIAKCQEMAGTTNVYVGINERNTGGTTDESVAIVRTTCFDVDPVRPKGTSSTDEQLAEAGAVARSVSDYMVAQGFNRPSLGMSGNGYQIWFQLVEQPITSAKDREQVTLQLKAFESDIRKRFQTRDIRSGRSLSCWVSILGIFGPMSKIHLKNKNSDYFGLISEQPALFYEKNGSPTQNAYIKRQPQKTTGGQTTTPRTG